MLKDVKKSFSDVHSTETELHWNDARPLWIEKRAHDNVIDYNAFGKMVIWKT